MRFALARLLVTTPAKGMDHASTSVMETHPLDPRQRIEGERLILEQCRHCGIADCANLRASR